jgi:hypothetical protein
MPRLARFLSVDWSRLGVVLYWIACLVVVGACAPSESSSSLPNIVVRKFFHIVAVVMFAPVIILDVRMNAPMCSHP